ncbi:hypothetical protein Ddye_031954 [Dipteronia dyeriana]|uniref:Uncharacterized protein n=1 Tax=Dipteronia dyeriana TaxID=168575 RepID=A0AAD9TJD7_9ROSI|nr:hypothetical protein Ddye_031954 [Dipteronia dyeriana]
MLSSSNSHGHGHEQLQIKQNEKFFSRVMSKETSMANSSSRVYYRGASGSVPFMWESRPGTPKHTFNDTTLPPLTPPPSYLSGSGSKTNKNFDKNLMNKSKILTTINLLFIVNNNKKKKNINKKKKKNHVSPSSSSWSSTSCTTSSSLSSTSSASSSTLSWSSSSCYSFSSRSRLHDNVHYDDHDDENHQHDHGYSSSSSSSSTLCFDRSFNLSSSRGRYSMMKMKNALLSIVGHGSSDHQGTA